MREIYSYVAIIHMICLQMLNPAFRKSTTFLANDQHTKFSSVQGKNAYIELFLHIRVLFCVEFPRKNQSVWHNVSCTFFHCYITQNVYPIASCISSPTKILFLLKARHRSSNCIAMIIRPHLPPKYSYEHFLNKSNP